MVSHYSSKLAAHNQYGKGDKMLLVVEGKILYPLG